MEPPPPPGPLPSQPAPPGQATNRRGPPRPEASTRQQRASSIPTFAGSCAKFSQASWAPPCWAAVLRALLAAPSTRCWSWRARGLPSRRLGPPPLPVPGLPEHRLGFSELRGLPFHTLVLLAPVLSSAPGPFPPASRLCSFQAPACPVLQSLHREGQAPRWAPATPRVHVPAGVMPAPPPPRQGMG